MNENIPQTSASERIEAARKALAWYDDDSEAGGGIVLGGQAVAEALRPLITPPGVGESEEQIVNRVTGATMAYGESEGLSVRGFVQAGVRFGIRAGIQSAHETWEPADKPSQEQMLRWLGIEHYEFDAIVHISEQVIEREEI